MVVNQATYERYLIFRQVHPDTVLIFVEEKQCHVYEADTRGFYGRFNYETGIYPRKRKAWVYMVRFAEADLDKAVAIWAGEQGRSVAVTYLMPVLETEVEMPVQMEMFA